MEWEGWETAGSCPGPELGILWHCWGTEPEEFLGERWRGCSSTCWDGITAVCSWILLLYPRALGSCQGGALQSQFVLKAPQVLWESSPCLGRAAPLLWLFVPGFPYEYHRILEWSGLEETLKLIPFPLPAMIRDCPRLL